MKFKLTFSAFGVVSHLTVYLMSYSNIALCSSMYCGTVKERIAFQNPPWMSCKRNGGWTEGNEICAREGKLTCVQSKGRSQLHSPAGKYDRQGRPCSIDDDNSTPTESGGDNQLLNRFGIDLGPLGSDIYKWLWPAENKNSVKRNRKKLKYINDGGYFPPSTISPKNEGSNRIATSRSSYRDLHRYILHNYGSESIEDIYRRIGFYMKISPRVLHREVAAITGMFGINALQPQESDIGTSIRADVACLRRIKAKIYCILGLKLMKYHLLLLLRYIRLGIPPEIRERYISDLLTRANVSSACSMICSHTCTALEPLSHDNYLSPRQELPSQKTYPNRVDFTDHGFPYSSETFYDNPVDGWSPRELVLPRVFASLGERGKSKLVYIASALHPEYGLQIIKNIAFCAGYRSEKDLLQKFCLRSEFGSRGAKSFISKLKEELISATYLKKASSIATSSATLVEMDQAEGLLSKVPAVAGLVKRHLESGHNVMPIRTARMIFKRLRSNASLRPDEMTLWDIMRGTILRRVPKTPLSVYRQIKMELFASDVYLSPYLEPTLIRRGIATAGLYDMRNNTQSLTDAMDHNEKSKLAKRIRKNLRKDMERAGLTILDAMSAVAGYESVNHILVLAALLSEKSSSIKLWRSQQPGPDFEHSTSLEIKDFKYMPMA